MIGKVREVKLAGVGPDHIFLQRNDNKKLRVTFANGSMFTKEDAALTFSDSIGKDFVISANGPLLIGEGLEWKDVDIATIHWKYFAIASVEEC
ncbi:MAG TPA: hypothetical protein VK805_13370 [Candidatus Baltobacteraceae bacterium]|jgi:hypothetical protein|nr:hypothetical protein [Candidatus Baltobacteraceae bacterium]